MVEITENFIGNIKKNLHRRAYAARSDNQKLVNHLKWSLKNGKVSDELKDDVRSILKALGVGQYEIQSCG